MDIKVIENKAISDYLKYQDLRKKFDEQKGIIQPIRATVKVYSAENSFRSIIRSVINDTITNTNTSLMTFMGHSPEEGARYKASSFVTDTTTVGYLTAYAEHCGDNKVSIKFGCSFCKPSDFPRFQKHIGLTKAIEHYRSSIEASSEAKAMKQLTEFDSEMMFLDLLNMGSVGCKAIDNFILDYLDNGDIIVYYFPYVLAEQLEYFIKRCTQYFKGKHE